MPLFGCVRENGVEPGAAKGSANADEAILLALVAEASATTTSGVIKSLEKGLMEAEATLKELRA